jgi:hypothetical protein
MLIRDSGRIPFLGNAAIFNKMFFVEMFLSFLDIIFDMHNKGGVRLVISLKSSSIELSVVDFKEKPQILFSKTETLLTQEAVDPSSFKTTSLGLLEKLIKANIQEITGTLKGSHDCEIIFHSPWFLPELISEENKGQKVSLKKFFMGKVQPPKQKDYQQIENKITNILLSGYQLSKLKDIPSDDIEIHLFRSFISKEVVKSIRNVFSKDLKQVKKFEFSTSTMMLYESLKELFLQEDNLTFINIGGEITEVGIVERDILTHSSTIPMGSHMFSRELDTFISKKGGLNTLQFLADSSTDAELDKAKKEKIQKVKDVWETEILKTLDESEAQVPKNIFVFSNNNSIDFFSKMLKESEKIREKGFEIFTITPEIYKDKVENIEQKVKKNVEYLISSHYLSIKE